MKKITFTILLISIVLGSCKTQKDFNQVIKDNNLNQKILFGKIDRNGLMKKPFKDWFTKEYDAYTPDATSINHLKSFMADNAKIVIVLATWCPDSQREVPRFYKILDAMDFDETKVEVIAVDKDFYAGDDVDVAQYQIDKVPTIIYYHYGYEAGRIEETPSFGSLEKDLVDFTKRKGKN